MSGGGGGGKPVNITNFGADTYREAHYKAINELYKNNMANADKWMQHLGKANESYEKNEAEYIKLQEKYLDYWKIAQAAYGAAATLLAKNIYEASKHATDKQFDIADRQEQRAKEAFDRYNRIYAPCEDKTVQKECSRPEYKEDIDEQVKRAGISIYKIKAKSLDNLKAIRSRYCAGAFCDTTKELELETLKELAKNQNAIRRFLEEREFNRDTHYFNRKLQLFNVGNKIEANALNIESQSLAVRANAEQIRDQARQQFYGSILSSLGGILGAFGPTVPTHGSMGYTGGFGISNQGFVGVSATPGISSYSPRHAR